MASTLSTIFYNPGVLRNAFRHGDPTYHRVAQSWVGIYEFIVNPIVDVGFGSGGGFDFLPAARLARKINKDIAVALEYYTDLGRPGSLLRLQQQSHQLFAAIDFKVGKIDVDFGVGRGLTEGPDRWIAKTILFYAFPVEKKPDETEMKQDDDGEMKKPPNMKLSPRQKSPADTAHDPLFNVR